MTMPIDTMGAALREADVLIRNVLPKTSWLGLSPADIVELQRVPPIVSEAVSVYEQERRSNSLVGVDFAQLEERVLSDRYAQAVRALEAAAEDFVKKVDTGHARSKRSYAAFKDALELMRLARMQGDVP